MKNVGGRSYENDDREVSVTLVVRLLKEEANEENNGTLDDRKRRNHNTLFYTDEHKDPDKINRIYHRSPMQTEKSQPEGKRLMPETRFTEFPALSVDSRVGISHSASETNV